MALSISDINKHLNNLNNYGKTSKNNMSGSISGESFGIDSFMTLLAAQMTNQDPMNPKSDTDFIAQMAQFTSLQVAQTQTEVSYAQYGATMVGKRVQVATTDKNGALQLDVGIVDSCQLLGGKCILTVNGKEYDLSSVMQVVTPDYVIPDPDKKPGVDDPDKPPEVEDPDPPAPEHPDIPPDEKPDETPPVG